MMLVVLLTLALTGVTPSVAIDPFYAAPGNVSILALFDLHLGVQDNGDCNENLDMYAMDKALGVIWTSKQNNTGLVLYDTCGSPSRALKVIQQTFLEDVCDSTQTTIIGAVLVHSSSAVIDVIAGPLALTGLLHVNVGPSPANQSGVIAGQRLVVNTASYRKIEAAVMTLVKLNWTYITVVSDTTMPTEEFLHFFRLLKDRGICWQYSTSGTDPTNLLIDPDDIKTTGVVLLTSDFRFAEEFTKRLPASLMPLVVSDDTRSTAGLLDKVLVLSESFPALPELVAYLGNDLWTSAGPDNATRQYYTDRFAHCSFNDTSQVLTCNGTEAEAYFTRKTSERDMKLALDSYSFLQSAVQLMVTDQCASFDASSCSVVGDIVSGRVQPGQGFRSSNGEAGHELIENPYTIPVTWVTEGATDQKLGEYTTTDEVVWFPQAVDAAFGQAGIPSSTCPGWCPSCSNPCRSADSKDTVEAGFYTVPGDILLTSLFPFSNQGDSPFSCGGYALQKFGNVYSEAFLDATRSFRASYPHLLPNVSVGALVLDSCSSPDIVRKTILDFQACRYRFTTYGNDNEPSPAIVPGYLVQEDTADSSRVNYLSQELSRLDKLGAVLGSDGSMVVNGLAPADDSTDLGFEGIFKFVHHMNWSHVGIVVSSELDPAGRMEAVFEMGLARNVCIAFYSTIGSEDSNSPRAVVDTIKRSSATVIIVLVTGDDAKKLFSSIRLTDYLSRTWVFNDGKQNLKDRMDLSLPVGSIVLEDRGQQNRGFNQRYPSIDSSSSNPWSVSFNQEESGCQESSCRQQTNSQTFMVASAVIKAVDTMLHALHMAYVRLCPEQTGLCPQFSEEGFKTAAMSVKNVSFLYQSEEGVRFMKHDDESASGVFGVSVFQNSGFEVVGFVGDIVNVDEAAIKYYDSRGVQLARPRESVCYSDCRCLNNKTEDDGPATSGLRLEDLDQEMGFQPSTAVFSTQLWVIIVVIIAGSGSVITILLMIFIMCKICGGALVRRYLVLGLLLLLSVIFMFLSVLPFLFSPSENVCGMRFLAHGFSFAFCFAIILTKLTTLRDYKHIGLGGEISRINQMLFVFFITGVQVAIGVQWWVMQRPMSVSQQVLTDTENGTQEMTYYACQLDRKDFVAYHSYVLLVLVLCCFYSIGVRNETQNMKEARLLLVSSWISLVLWAAVIVTILVLDRQHFELIASVGLLANALTIMVVVYIPKLNTISKLKYEVSEKRTENGYKIDTDFQYERPYSLPGTMHSSITDKTLSYPRSLATFDTSLSY